MIRLVLSLAQLGGLFGADRDQIWRQLIMRKSLRRRHLRATLHHLSWWWIHGAHLGHLLLLQQGLLALQ